MKYHIKCFNDAANLYDKNIDLQIIASNWVAANVRKLFAINKNNIIDVGSGTGAISGLLPEYNIIGIDAAENMCISAVNSLCAEAEYLPIKDATIDGYLSSLCWQWVDFKLALSEVDRVLKTGGTAIITTLVAGTMQELQDSYKVAKIAPRMLTYLDVRTIKEYVANTGLSLQLFEVENISIFHESALCFFKQLKNIGALGIDGREPLSAAELRKLIKYYEKNYTNSQGKVRVTYMLAKVIINKS